MQLAVIVSMMGALQAGTPTPVPSATRVLVYIGGHIKRLTKRQNASTALLPCNIVFIKVQKCASSTSGGVTRRIGAHNGLHGVGSVTWPDLEPGLWAAHDPIALHWQALGLLKQRTVLWTVVRQPAERCLSWFYHIELTRQVRTSASVSQKTEYLHSAQCRDYMFDYLKPPDRVALTLGLQAWTPASLLGQVYSFVGVAERYDESMVLLSSLLGIPLSHVLYLKSKDSTASGRDGRGFQFVAHLPLSEEPSQVRRAATSATFNKSNARDLELHRLANEELDRMWREDREALDAKLAAFQSARARVEEKCAGLGEKTSSRCYWNDNGCGYQCLDALGAVD